MNNPIQQEILQLEASFSASSACPAVPVLKSINHKGITWGITLANDQACQMHSTFNDIDHEIYVVHVDAQKFYYHWLKSSQFLNQPTRREVNCSLIKDMPKDHKFHRAAAGFANSHFNPVPLAFISPSVQQGHDCIAFNNGVTRTIWLLANGAKSFPIEVHKQQMAQHLFGLAGIGEPPLSNQDYKDRHCVQKPYYLTQAYFDTFKDDWLESAELNERK